MGKYLGHKTRESGDSRDTGHEEGGVEAALWGPWWVASWVGAGRGCWLEEGGSGAGLARVMVHLDRSFFKVAVGRLGVGWTV